MKPKTDITEDYQTICKAWSFDAERLKTRWRIRELTIQRRIVAKALHDLGHSYTSIGAVMNRDHSSVMYMCNEEFREHKLGKMRAYHPARQ